MPELTFGKPTFGGNGCAAGSASATSTPDEQTISIIFSGLRAEAGKPAKRGRHAVRCSVAIPIKGIDGPRFVTLDSRIYYTLPKRGRGRVSVAYSGRREKKKVAGGKAEYEFTAHGSGQVLIQHDFEPAWVAALAGSSQASIVIEVESSVWSNDAREQAVMMVDSWELTTSDEATHLPPAGPP